MTLEGSSTEFPVETSSEMDWTCLGLLSRWKKLCRCIELLFILYRIIYRFEHWPHFLFCFTVTLTFGVRTWKMNRINGWSTLYIPAKIHGNSLNNNRKVACNIFAKDRILVTLTFNTRSWNLSQVVPLSSTTYQPKGISHIALNPSRRCLTCGTKWTFCRTGPKNLWMF